MPSPSTQQLLVVTTQKPASPSSHSPPSLPYTLWTSPTTTSAILPQPPPFPLYIITAWTRPLLSHTLSPAQIQPNHPNNNSSTHNRALTNNSQGTSPMIVGIKSTPAQILTPLNSSNPNPQFPLLLRLIRNSHPERPELDKGQSTWAQVWSLS